MSRSRVGLVLIVALLLGGGAPGGQDEAAAGGPVAIPLGLDQYLPVPASNPVTAAKVTLGRRLFFDTRLSADGSTACVTCHDPGRAFTDGRAVAQGIHGRLGPRNSPTLVNRAYGGGQFFDGRAATLEEQALRPIEDVNELGHSVTQVVEWLRADPEYRREFGLVFGADPVAASLARALATYVRSILSGDSPFDRYQAGDRAALSREQEQGLQIFLGKGRCSACHVGPTLTDEEFHNTGVAWPPDRPASSPGFPEAFLDAGRYSVTGTPTDLGSFKTPTLREISHTAPYMHDGSLPTLADVVDFYNLGGRANPYRDHRIRPLGLTGDEQRALVSFLEALSGMVDHGGANGSSLTALGVVPGGRERHPAAEVVSE